VSARNLERQLIATATATNSDRLKPISQETPLIQQKQNRRRKAPCKGAISFGSVFFDAYQRK